MLHRGAEVTVLRRGEEAEEKRLVDEDETMVQEKGELLCPRWEGQQETCTRGSA